MAPGHRRGTEWSEGAQAEGVFDVQRSGQQRESCTYFPGAAPGPALAQHAEGTKPGLGGP